MSRNFRFPCAVLALTALAACFPEGVNNAASKKAESLAASVSPAPAGVVAVEASPRPAVLVTDKSGKPVPAVSVTFAVVAGNGSVTGATQVTDRDGIATVGNWVLGTTTGANKLSASSGSLAPVFFTVSAAPGAPAQLVAVNDGQSAPAGSKLPNPVGVKVKDAYGNVIPGANVTFAPSAGSASPTTVASDADGNAVTEWTLGNSGGAMQLVASLGTRSPVALSATAIGGTPTSVAKVSGDAQIGTVAQALTNPITVVVRDENGNPVRNVLVSFTAANGSSVNPASATTGMTGEASTAWTMGTIAGSMSVSAAVGNLTPVSFSATAKAGAPAQVAKNAGSDNQYGTAGKALAQAVGVTVRDQYGNLVQGASVNFAAANGSSAAPTSATTNSSGQASTSWTMPTTVGVVNMSVTVAALPAVGFVATSQADVPASMQKVASGDNQVGDTGSPLAQPISVILRDQYGNAAPGFSVSFAASHGGSASPASASSNADGQVATSWTLGSTAGAQTLVASYGTLSQTFNATANAPSGGCEPRGTLGTSTTMSGNALNSTCMFNDNRARIDLWSLALSASTAVEISLNAVDENTMDAYLTLYRDTYTDLDKIIAFNDDDFTSPLWTTNSKVKLLGGAGTFLVGATYLAGSPGQTGNYSLQTRAWSGAMTACEDVFILVGSSSNQHLDGGDCFRPDGRWSDNAWIYLQAGEQIRVDMTASTFDAKLEIDGPSGVLASDDNGAGGTNPRLNFTAPSKGYYLIAATAAVPNKGGDYSLAVSRPAASLMTSSLRSTSSSNGGFTFNHSVKRTGSLNKQ